MFVVLGKLEVVPSKFESKKSVATTLKMKPVPNIATEVENQPRITTTKVVDAKITAKHVKNYNSQPPSIEDLNVSVCTSELSSSIEGGDGAGSREVSMSGSPAQSSSSGYINVLPGMTVNRPQSSSTSSNSSTEKIRAPIPVPREY